MGNVIDYFDLRGFAPGERGYPGRMVGEEGKGALAFPITNIPGDVGLRDSDQPPTWDAASPGNFTFPNGSADGLGMYAE